ncbi:MAG: hypothetical protein ABIQ52_17060 [Vicinamibacterales bacterium]
MMFTAALVLLLMPAPARAQAGPGSRPHTGEDVIVTQSTSGQEIRGHIVELSATTLALLVNGQRVEVPIDRVLRIDARHDSVKNGAAIGALSLGGLSALGCFATVGTTSGICVTSTALNAGLGALAGAGIDALHKGRTTIYSKPSPVSVAIAPVAKGARGLVRIGW